MKKIMTLNLILIGLFSYGQESLFTDLNKKGYGTFNVNAQYFWMHRSRTDVRTFDDPNRDVDYQRHDNSGSVAFNFQYESPRIHNFSLRLSYLEAFQFQEYIFHVNNNGENSGFSPGNLGARNVQNDNFRFLNNLSLNLHLDFINLKDATLSVGRFPLDMEFMTRYAIRQKEQAYEGVYLDIPSISNWRFKAGYIDRFSSWTTNPGDIDFAPIGTYYGVADSESGQFFGEATYNSKDEALFASGYFVRVEDYLDVLGFSTRQELFSLDKQTKVHLKVKGVGQWGFGSRLETKPVFAVQPGLMIANSKYSAEVGLFQVEGPTAFLNPFGGRFIISEPLWEIDVPRIAGTTTYYFEGIYRFTKGKIYAMYLRTENPNADYQVTEEYNIITSVQLRERLSGGVKLALYRGDRFEIDRPNPQSSAILYPQLQQMLDIRLVLNYSF